jgi:hypothetical protein
VASDVTDHSANLSWAGIVGATHVRYYATGTTDYVIKETHMNHIMLNNLAANTPYSWDLSNFCNGGWTEYTGNGSFTTLTDTIPPATCIPTDLADTNVTAISVDLSWSGIYGPTHVRYYPTGTTDYVVKNGHMHHISLDSLQSNTAYSWDLSNFCEGQWTEYTGDGSFTTLSEMYITGVGNIDGISAGISNLSIYPNPMKDIATVTFTTAESGSCVYKIMDVTGRELTSTTIQATAGKNSFELNLAGNPKGIYFLNLRKGNELNHVKLLKL